MMKAIRNAMASHTVVRRVQAIEKRIKSTDDLNVVLHANADYKAMFKEYLENGKITKVSKGLGMTDMLLEFAEKKPVEFLVSFAENFVSCHPERCIEARARLDLQKDQAV